MVFEIRKYILERLYFPHVLSVDTPGLILHKKIALFGGRDVVTRSILTFEETYVDLFLDTIKEIGEEKTSQLWYRIGKDFMYRYFGFYKGFSRSRGNIRRMMDYFCKHFSSTGMSIFNNYNYDLSKEKFVFYGIDCVIYRHTNDASYLEGAISGMVSCLLNKNVEAKMIFDKNVGACRIVADSSISERYLVSDKKISEISVVPIIKGNHSFSSNLSTFYDFLKFGIVKIDNSKKLSFKEKTIVPVEMGLPMIFFLNYRDLGLEKLYADSVVSSFEKIFRNIFSNQKSEEDKILAFRNIVSAFGWAESFFSRQGKSVKVSFLNPFFYRRIPSIVQYVFNAFLNYLYNKKFVIDSVGESGVQYSLKEC